MTLKSRPEVQREHSKAMDLMDVNQVLEVPDTPDRLVASTHDTNIETQSNFSSNKRKVSKDCANGRIRNHQRENGKSLTLNGNRKLFSHSDSSSSFKHPRPPVDTTRHDKGKALCNSDGHRVNASRIGVLSLNRVHTTDSLDRSSKSCKVDTTSDCKKGVDFHDRVHSKAESNSHKAPQKKMLVRNGCISPHNIAKSKQVSNSKDHESGNVVKEVQSGSRKVDIKDIIAEDKDSHRSKGKGVLHHHSSSKVPNAESSSLSHRRSIHKEPPIEAERWRTTHNHRKQRDIEMQKDHRNEKDIVNLDDINLESVSPHRHLLGVNRQKEGTPSRNLGKRSLSFVNDSIGETSTSRPKRNKNLNGVGPSNCVPEPITVNNDEGLSVRSLQVEADERLARELQEQLYNEELTPVTDIDQINSHLAFAMPAQQDNSSRHAGGRLPYRRQAPSSMIRLERAQPNTPRRSLAQRLTRPQTRTTTRMSQLRTQFRSDPLRLSSNSNRRNSIFPSNMDVDMRVQILETLEAIGDTRRRIHPLQIGREFNDGDYEMLLALDDNNHQHGGATRAQINNLPESKVQAENLQECSICLETPTIGETIRHLPCLHRFHKACIDPWLRRKTSCPICKSSIT